MTDKNRDKKNTASTRRPHEQTANEEYRQLLEDRQEAEKMIAHESLGISKKERERSTCHGRCAPFSANSQLPSYPNGEAMVKDILS